MPPRKAMSPSPPLSVASRPATVPPPIHPDFKRKRTPTPEPSPAKKRRGPDGAIWRSVAKYGYDAFDAFEYPSSGWVALSAVVPHDVELSGEHDGESESEEEKEDNNDDRHSCPSIKSTPPSHRSPDDCLEIANFHSSTSTESPKISPTAKHAPLPGSNAAPDETNLPDSDHLWNIDGLDVRAVMKKGSKSKFTADQEKMILLWMKKNEARGITGHEGSYNKLIAELKFSSQGQSKEVETALRHKVKGRINTIYATLKGHGIVTDVEVETKKWQENNKIRFADYTVTWLREGWDGTIEVPRSWWTETIEWDGVWPDAEPGVFAVESSKPPTPQKSKKKTARANHSSDVPVVNVLGEVQQFWTKEIGDAKREADMKLDKNVWTHDMLYQSEWNVAAVQAQYIEVDMSKKTLLDGVDGLEGIIESSQSSRAKDMIYSTWDYGRAAAGCTPGHHFTSAAATSESESENTLMALLSSSEPEVDEPEIEQPVDQTPVRRRKVTQSIQSSRTQPEPKEIESDDENTDPEDSDQEDSENKATAGRVVADGESIVDEEESADEGDSEDDADEEDNAVEEASVSDTEIKDIDCESVAAEQPILVYEVIPLTCDTYPKWKLQLRTLLLTYDAWGVITGDIKMADDEWVNKSGLCLDWMLSTMGEEVRNALEHIQDPLKLWALLRDEFEVL